MTSIIVNADMGESLGIHSFGNDAAIMPMLDAANIACGFHAGDPVGIATTVDLAIEHGVDVGAHPGLPDLVGFGRREMRLDAEEVDAIIRYQVGALAGFLRRRDVPLSHIKPHGSLYGMLARDESLMTAAAAVARDYGVPIYGMPGTAHERVAEREGVEFVAELYVDLDYRADGSLVILRQPHATEPSAVRERVRRAIDDGVVVAEDGTELPLAFDSICVHSDGPAAIDVARAVRDTLKH